MTALAHPDRVGSSEVAAATPARRPVRHRLVALVLLVAGVLVMLYPVFATLHNNRAQREFAELYNQQVQQVAPDSLSASLQVARNYNAGFTATPILDPWLDIAQGAPESEQYAYYESMLADFDAMARVRVPNVGIDLPVYHGTTEDVLAKGAGHLYGTSLPVGGSGTHAVITSHTGLTNATLFDHLIDVREGDLILVEVLGETLAYEVDQIKVVLPDEIGDLVAVPGEDILTLFTCTPYAVNSHRLLVRGHRVEYTPEVAETVAVQEDAVPALEDWMIWLIGGSMTAVTVFGAVLIYDNRRRHARATTNARHTR